MDLSSYVKEKTVIYPGLNDHWILCKVVNFIVENIRSLTRTFGDIEQINIMSLNNFKWIVQGVPKNMGIQ